MKRTYSVLPDGIHGRRQEVEVNLGFVDLSDRRHPDRSGRYVRLIDLVMLLREARLTVDPIGTVEDAVFQIGRQ